MRKTMSSILLAAIFAAVLGGCGAGNQEASAAPNAAQGTEDLTGTAGSDGPELSVTEGGILDPSAVLSLNGKDNSLDIYSAAVRIPLQAEKPEGALEGGGQRSILGASRAYHLKKHLLTTKSWDELIFVTAEGETGSDSFPHKNQIWDIGPAAGTDHYVALVAEAQEDSGDNRCFLEERDESHGKLRSLPLDFLGRSEADVVTHLSSFALDQSGVFHLVRHSGDDGWQYQLVSQEGESLAKYGSGSGYIRSLVPLYDGRIAFLTVAQGSDGGLILQYMNAQAGSPVTLATLEEGIYHATLLDERTLLYADKDGVYRSGLSGEEPELLYRWINHGIIAHGVSALQMDGEGRIELIYRDSENDNYLCLEPTTEEVELCEITIAISPHDREAYQAMAAEFNKRYPNCHIELMEYSYGDTALLTQLTAGKGPVLVNTFLVNFEEMEKLWEPLDTVMGQLGITDELYPAALEAGRINGTLYGMARDFSLRTVVAVDPGLKGWDYDAFFQGIEDRPGLEAILNYYDYEGDGGGIYYLIALLNHGLDDNCFIIPDGETGAMHFDSRKFRKILEAAKKYCSHEGGIQPGDTLLEGRALCNTVSILKPENIAAFRTIYGEEAYYVGYPTKDGGAHFMDCINMLSIRRSATKEEKEAAAAFLALLLSYEGQTQASKKINFDLSVRRDVLEEQIASMSPMNNDVVDFGNVNISNMDRERDGATLLELIDSARPAKDFPRELNGILSEELESYLEGSITEDMLIDHLENRIGLYLGERN